MKEIIEGLTFIGVAIALLVLSIRTAVDSTLFNNAQYIILIAFSLFFGLMAYRDKIYMLFRNKDDT